MAEHVSFTAASNRHLRLPGEKLGDFAAHLKRLTAADRTWFAERFAVEYGYEVDTGTAKEETPK